jgi:hypothetical protein
VSLEDGGKVTSHLVKYSHHADGRAHFSQTGKIITAIRRQLVALERQHGHIFSLLIQGLNALDVADPVKDAGATPKRTVVDFQTEPAEAIKFVARWFDVNKLLRFNNPTLAIGPTLLTMDRDGIQETRVSSPAPIQMPGMCSLLPVKESPRSVRNQKCSCFTAASIPRK